MNNRGLLISSLSSACCRKNSENVEEDHDYVRVKNEGTEDVVIDFYLIALASQDKLCIKDEVESEY